MKKEQKKEFVAQFMGRNEPFNEIEWNKIVKQYDINHNDIMNNKNSKYQYVDKNGNIGNVVYTISNGNAFDCPSLHCGRCNVPCYGLKGTFTWNATKVNKEFQRIILNIAPLEFIFDAIKYHSTSKRKAKRNLLKFLRLNEVSDMTQNLIDRITVLCKMLLSDKATQHIVVFTYTKMQHLRWSNLLSCSNFVVNNSQVINPLSSNGNVFIAVEKEIFDSIVETDTVKKCNCETNCHGCEYCYKNNGYIIFCCIH